MLQAGLREVLGTGLNSRAQRFNPCYPVPLCLLPPIQGAWNNLLCGYIYALLLALETTPLGWELIGREASAWELSPAEE